MDVMPFTVFYMIGVQPSKVKKRSLYFEDLIKVYFLVTLDFS